MVFNSLGWQLDGIVSVPAQQLNGLVPACGGKPLPHQYIQQDGCTQLLFEAPAVPALGWRSYPLVPASASPASGADDAWTRQVETDYYTVLFNDAGQMVRLFDKRANREVLRPGCLGNVLQVLEDKPHQFDAWNTEVYANDKVYVVEELVSARVVENGPVQTSLSFVYRFGSSRIEQLVTFFHHHPGIRFDTRCQWLEQQMMLKAAFDVDVRSTKATYDIQFGNLERPTHNNTSWDFAQFEVCAQKWADLSEGNYGVALLNDCKYGYDIKNSRLRITLLRSPIWPDETADQGEHSFAYLLLPHQGSWKQGQVVPTAHLLNTPMTARLLPKNDSRLLPGQFCLASCNKTGVLVDTVKQSEDGNGWILRLYEYEQNRHTVGLQLFATPKKAVLCDLMENELEPLAIASTQLNIPIKPFEIVTLKLCF